jgi:hypothetical protein
MLEYGDLSFLAKKVAMSILKIALCQKPLAKKLMYFDYLIVISLQNTLL